MGEPIEISLKFNNKLEQTSNIQPVRSHEGLLEHAKAVFRRDDIYIIEKYNRQSVEWIRVYPHEILHPSPGDKFKFQIVSQSKVRLYIINKSILIANINFCKLIS